MANLRAPDIDTDDLLTVEPDKWGAMARTLQAIQGAGEELGGRVIYDLMLEVQAQIIERSEQPQFVLEQTADTANVEQVEPKTNAQLELALIHALMEHGLGTDAVKIAADVAKQVA